MPIDSSIYGLLDTKGLQSGLQGIADGYLKGQEHQNRLSQLAKQGELTDLQISAAKRAESALPEQKRQKDMQELSAALAFGIQQKNGYSNQGLMDSTYQEAMRRGLKDEDVAQLFQPWASVANQTDGVVVQPTEQEQQGVARTYLQQANPAEAVKQGLEAMNRKQDIGADEVFKIEQDKSGAMFGITKSGKTIPLDINGQPLIGNQKPSSSAYQAVPMIDPDSGETIWGQFDKTRGGVAPVAGRIKNPIYSPSTQGAIAGARASSKEYGESGAKANIELPKNIQEAENTVKLVDDLMAHPGFKQAVGTSSLMGIQHVPGTDAKDFKIRENQLLGKQFLQAYETLKGGGQITEVEGKKATDAMSRMQSAGTEESYVQAAKEFQGIIRQGVERAKIKAGQQPARRESDKSSQYERTATNPQTGQKIGLRNGQWEPIK